MRVGRHPRAFALHPHQPEIAARRSVRNVALVEQHDRRALGPRPPGDGATDQSAADDDQVESHGCFSERTSGAPFGDQTIAQVLVMSTCLTVRAEPAWRTRRPGRVPDSPPLPHPWTTTIQGTPNRSFTIPNDDAKNVFINGMVTTPPSLSAANTCFAAASSAGDTDRENP